MVNRKSIKKQYNKHKLPFLALGTALLVFMLIVAMLVTFSIYYRNKIFPNTFVAGVNVSGLTQNQSSDILSRSVLPPKQIILVGPDGNKYEIYLNDVEFKYNFETAATNAYNIYRTKNAGDDRLNQIVQNIDNYVNSVLSPLNQTNVLLVYTIDDNKLKEVLSVISNSVAIEPVYPSVTVINGEVAVNTGSPGTDIDTNSLKTSIDKALTTNIHSTINIPTQQVNPTLSPTQTEEFANEASNYLDSSITLTIDRQSETINTEVIMSFLAPNNEYYEDKIDEHISTLSETYNREAQNPVFEFSDGKVIEFTPAKNGIVINEIELRNNILSELSSFTDSDIKVATIQIPVQESSPEYETAEVNDLGIREILGRGDSRYAGSIPGRIHNISHASSKINGVLVPPGEVFSFNNTVGDVSVLTGYQQAYIIKDGRTVLGDGGGLCQVSTTLFRAALDAGLPIAERRAHSYRVGYYEQDSKPGIDATVYSPTTDFKFTNDTPAHLLVQTVINPSTASLAFEIYGTNDGRVSTVTTPVINSQTPPPEDVYQDDPTLPAGTIKQVDWKAWGAKVSFDYSVVRNGEVIYEKTFYSNYRPWQSVFLRGTGPVI